MTPHLTTWLRRLIPFILAGVGIFFIVVGILVNYIKKQQNIVLDSLDRKSVGTESARIISKMIVIDVSGAVEQAGVYIVPYDSRISNVLITAGGLSPKADRKYISRYINLAQRVIDGMKIYIPFENEISSNPVTQSINKSININLATVSELDSLSGIGMTTANKIISGRPYGDISDLVSKKILSASIYEKIKDKISIY